MAEAAMKRVLVTGSDGLIGRLLMDAWRESGAYEPVGLARCARGMGYRRNPQRRGGTGDESAR